MRSKYTLTPAAMRALAAAADWTANSASSGIGLPEMLLGLLDEPECRAALLLARQGVTPTTVLDRWPALTRRKTPVPSLPTGGELTSAFAAARERLADLPQPLELATEHVLLGLVSEPGEVSSWLVEKGFNAEDLDDEVHRFAGCQRDASALDLPEDPVFAAMPQSIGEIDSVALLGRQAVAADDCPAGVLRAIDAAANRAAEGLRVVEDHVRFILDDAHLTGEIKALRHALADAMCFLSPRQRFANRETQLDVGTSIKLPGEVRRADAADAVAANWQRVKQSLRSLEEFAKTIDQAAAATIEHLRYRAYSLEKAAGMTASAGEKLALARLYVLIGGFESEGELAARVETLLAAGVDVLQLRDKKLDDRTLLARAKTMRRLTRGTRALFIVNDRADIAAASDADGVHLGQDELPLYDARRIVGAAALVGISTHSIEQARAAVLDGADYLGVGPTFPSTTKAFSQFAGLDFVRAVAQEIRLPAFAIGGITAENVPQVVSAGLGRVAIGAAIADSADPAAAARRLRAVLS